jgi:hypothetical protein
VGRSEVDCFWVSTCDTVMVQARFSSDSEGCRPKEVNLKEKGAVERRREEKRDEGKRRKEKEEVIGRSNGGWRMAALVDSTSHPHRVHTHTHSNTAPTRDDPTRLKVGTSWCQPASLYMVKVSHAIMQVWYKMILYVQYVSHRSVGPTE